MYFGNIAGLVGEGPAAEYTGFKRIFENLPDVEGILMNPAKADVPDDMPILFALLGRLPTALVKTTLTVSANTSDACPLSSK